MPHRAEAAKRTRLERIVRRLTSELLLTEPKISGQGSQTWASCTERVLCAGVLLAWRIPTDGVQLLSSCTEYVADKECKLQWRSVGDPHVEKIFVWRRLTPELSRAAARLGVMVNATI